jgi:hypothetical protein
LHPKRSGVSVYALVLFKKITEFWSSSSMFEDRLPEYRKYRSKTYRTNEIISRNFVQIYGFKNITGTSSFFCRTLVIFHFFRKYSYRNSGTWYELHGNFPKFCENFNCGLFRYRKPEVYMYFEDFSNYLFLLWDFFIHFNTYFTRFISKIQRKTKGDSLI